MDTKSHEEITEEITKRYSENPRGWKVSLRRSGRHGDVFIQDPVGELWQIKVDSLYKPRPLGVGTKIGVEEDAGRIMDDELPSFGLRPVSDTQMEVLLNGMEQGGPSTNTVREILSETPIKPSDAAGMGVIQGPVGFSSYEGYLSENQKRLDAKLEADIRDLLRKKGIGNIYG